MTTTPRWYKIITIIALLWNLLGCLAFFSDLAARPDDIAKLSADQQSLYAARTVWSVMAYAIAVLGGTAGSLGLVLRKRWSKPLLWASLAGLIVQDFGLLVIANGINLVGSAAVILQSIVFLIAIGLLVLEHTAEKHGWIPIQSLPAPNPGDPAKSAL